MLLRRKNSSRKMAELHANFDDDFDVFADAPMEVVRPSTLELPLSPKPSKVVMDSPSSEILRDDQTFIQNVSQFYNQKSLSDVLLKIGDERFYGHKFVLAKSSDVFRTMLYERPWSRNITEEVELNESPECQSVFDIFLRYLYTAELAISTDTAVGVLCLADKYNVASLKDLCVKYMIDHSKSPRVRNALAWYPWSKALHLPELFERCFQCICWNTHEIISSPEWVDMDMEFVSDILHSSELIVPDEYTLFEALVSWLMHDNHNHNMCDNASRLLPLIRFPQMMVGQLYQIEHHELSSSTECGELVRELIGKAYRFRALCPSQADLSVSFSEDFFMPRDFSRLSVDNVRMTNTLRFGIQVDVKMYVGPVPNEKRDGDWKITYRKNGEIWSLQIYCHESAMIHNEAKFQATLMVFDDEEKVIQVERPPVYVCSRGNHQNVQLTINEPEMAKTMGVIIKPMAN